MLENIEKSLENFKTEMREIIKDDEQYTKFTEKADIFYYECLKELKKELNYEKEELSKIKIENQDVKTQINDLKGKINNIYRDIYEDYDDFSIVCPYCNYEFSDEIDEDVTEITCPECNNIIELDWSGNPDSDVIDDDSQNGCNGNCSHCGGCNE